MGQELAEDAPSDLKRAGGGDGRKEDGAHHWRPREPIAGEPRVGKGERGEVRQSKSGRVSPAWLVRMESGRLLTRKLTRFVNEEGQS